MKRTLGAAGIAAILATASPARADHAQEFAAQALYDKALELMKAGKPASACPLLSESQRLDPAAGTQYRLADCLEKTGRPAEAWKLYTEVAEASKKAGRKDREAQARERAAIVGKLLPRLTITVPLELAKADGLAVTRDGKAVPREEWNREEPVEPGEHTVEVQAPGKKAWRGTITARVGATAEVRVPLLEAGTVVGPVAPKSESVLPVEAPQGGPNKTIVIAGVSVAAVAAAAGVGFGIGWGVENARPSLCTNGCTHLKNLMFWSFVSAGAVGGATLTYTLVSAKPKPSGVSQASVWVGQSAVGATFVRSW